MKVFLVGAITVCGRISPPVMGSDEDRSHLEKLRRNTGASLMGAATLRQEDPEMRTVGGNLPGTRKRAFVSRSGDLPIDSRKIFHNGPAPIIFTGADKERELLQKVAGRAKVVVLPAGPCGLSLKAAVDYLDGQKIESLLIEGGGKLNYAALLEGVVDELFLTVSPMLSGDSRAASLADGAAPLADPFMKLDMLSCRPAQSGELFVRYRIRR